MNSLRYAKETKLVPLPKGYMIQESYADLQYAVSLLHVWFPVWTSIRKADTKFNFTVYFLHWLNY